MSYDKTDAEEFTAAWDKYKQKFKENKDDQENRQADIGRSDGPNRFG